MAKSLTFTVGLLVGPALGLFVAPGLVGAVVVGYLLGAAEGTPVGLLEVGLTVGCVDGCVLGTPDG